MLTPPSSSLSATPLEDHERRHALIVEDDLLTGLDLQAMLQPLGYESFAFASTSDQALEQARLRTPDLATVDVGLLDGDGFAAAAGLAELLGALPTVFITGDPQSVRNADPARVVLGKPVTALDLRRAVGAAERAASPR